jgi:hypothetical protein
MMNSTRVLQFLVLVLFLLPAGARLAHAGPTDPVTVSLPPEVPGEAFVPGTRLLGNLPGVPYVEEEFFVEGHATLFNYAHNPPLGPTDLAAIDADVPYRTRLIVRRPVDPKAFNGTVVIEWWNSTAGFDGAPVWDQSAEYFARRGIAYVGVSNSTTAIAFLAGGCRVFGVLPPSCGSRYATLSLPENGLAYEMMSQIANLLKSDDPHNPLPQAYRVRRLFHAGESQQAGSVITYASAFHLDDVNDGYFIQSNVHARPINFGPRCDDAGAPAFPECTPRLAHPDSLVRTDLPVPVYQVITQTDFETLNFNVLGRQPDTPSFRYFEVAGAAHNVVHKDIELVPAGLLGPDALGLADLCASAMNSTADGPVFASYVLNALWARMETHADFRGYYRIVDRRVPAGQVMEAIDGVLARDALGNVIGGVRLPALEAPTATYLSTNTASPDLPPALLAIGNLACRLSGSVLPFDQATLDALYPNPASYLVRVRQSVDALQRQGLLLPEDAAKVMSDAVRSLTAR